MAPGISKVKQLSAGAAGRVKKQLNDLYLFISYKLHRELATFGVISLNAPDAGKDQPSTATTSANISVLVTDPASDTVKEWEASVTLDINNNPELSALGEQVLLVAESPISAAQDVVIRIGAKRASDPGSPGVAVVNATGTITITNAGANGDSLTVHVGSETFGPFLQDNSPKSIAALRTELLTALAGSTLVTATAGGAGVVNIAAIATGAAGNVLLSVEDTGTLQATAVGMSNGVNATTLGSKPWNVYEFKMPKATGMDQALAFVDDKGVVITDLTAIDWESLKAGVVSDTTGGGAMPAGSAAVVGGPAVIGAHRGLAMKLMVVPHDRSSTDKDWLYHAFVRQINPNIPKDYKEVADHFDGAAATIRATVIPTLTIQKVFESVPGSFRNMRGRTCTLKTETRELNRFDSSETHFFLGVVGTPTIQFQMDNESISQLEAIMYRWLVLS